MKLDENRIFDVLEELPNGIGIDLPDSDVGGLSDLASFLDNTHLLNELIDDDSRMDQSTVGFRLRGKLVLGRSVDEEVTFAASHFYELDFDDLKGIGAS
jgi:hypothetical protein